MSRSPEPPRFTTGERWVHGTFALLALVGLATAAVLYVPALSQAVGRRPVVSTVHEAVGLMLPLPLLVGWIASAGFRADVRRLERFTAADEQWLRSPARWLRTDHDGRFNGGQKLYAAVTLGSVLVLLMSGTVLLWASRFPLDWRVGATVVHDWTAFGFGLLVLGHVVLAVRSLSGR